jgi:uncharacterized integral membrane protein
MKNPKVIAGLVIGVLFLIFLFQNMDDVVLRLYFWQVAMPKIILVPLAILIGFVAGFVLAKMAGKARKTQPAEVSQVPPVSSTGTSVPKP